MPLRLNRNCNDLFRIGNYRSAVRLNMQSGKMIIIIIAVQNL